MCNKQVESLIQLFIHVLSFGLFLHQIKHNVVNSEVQFLHSFLTIFSPRYKKDRITPRLISCMVISKITRILGQPLVGGVEGFRKEKTETKSILLFAPNPQPPFPFASVALVMYSTLILLF